MLAFSSRVYLFALKGNDMKKLNTDSITTTVYQISSEASQGVGIQESEDGYVVGTLSLYGGSEAGAIVRLKVATSSTDVITDGLTRNCEARHMALGNDGAIYFTEGNINCPLGRIVPSTGIIEEIEITPAVPSRTLGYVAVDKKTGYLWITARRFDTTQGNYQTVIKYDPSTKNMSEYGIKTVSISSFPGDITVDGDSTVWFVSMDKKGLYKFIPTTQEFSYFETNIEDNISLNSITLDLNGSIWFTDTTYNSNAGAIGRFNILTTEYEVFTEGLNNGPPSDIVCMVDGSLWFNEHSGEFLGTVDQNTGIINELSTNAPGQLFGQGDLCVSKIYSNSIWSICQDNAIALHELV